MRVLIDTVTFLYALQSPDKLSRRARKVVEAPGNVVELSVLTLAEIALKRTAGKLSVRREELLAAIERMQLNLLPFTEEHALELFDLPSHHRDPFDRQLVAQALSEKIAVVTCDEQFRRYAGVSVIW